ncbi:hypothetical protein [Flavobacterium flavigenum]|uniref:hypothetical protein n=1 Tax=Flavobacterium flavigenum TaxID=3003258 RepID=UPI0022AC8D00|nr:hypothetical protein [Flavobacterium flavigenum]
MITTILKRNVKKTENLEEELSAFMSEHKNLDIKKSLEGAIVMIRKLSRVYKEGDIEFKRKVISSIYP